MNLKLFILTTFAAMAACSPSSIDKRACPFPAWFVESITATYSDDTYTPGLATFSLTHVLTNAKETVQCPLQFNSVCRLDSGTALDPALQIHFQVNMDIGWVTFNKTWECPGQSIPGRYVPYLPTYLPSILYKLP